MHDGTAAPLVDGVDAALVKVTFVIVSFYPAHVHKRYRPSLFVIMVHTTVTRSQDLGFTARGQCCQGVTSGEKNNESLFL